MKNSMPQTTMPLLPGEKPIPKAPSIVLDDGTNCIPQHFLSYQHTLNSVSEIISLIDFDPKYVLFVDEEQNSIFLQVGIIGKDNYLPKSVQQSNKIVYGRRWRVEPQLPSSEIIQTAFLACLKAREHEIRELFKYRSELLQKTVITTPFSCHHDLPLIAMSKSTDTSAMRYPLALENLIACLKKVTYADAIFKFKGLQVLPGDKQQYILSFDISPLGKSDLHELKQAISAHIVLNDLCEDTILYGLFDYVLALSNRYVEENFIFKGYARFSRNQSVAKISNLSAETRIGSQHNIDSEFATQFADLNYQTDATRVPKINNNGLEKKIKHQLKQFDIQYGFLPK
ncbi:hypothetical protein [Glaciecola petra]|uniref:Uncharacterized protein n=1 Tax=Glaciecola petra TaxID=3075602 RepID=A0ABU2ZPM0_9ALTE|nr:hypothetical protein [Aestuariibacter sp. P117]MDT0593993.1 hypothetical protein [Aestuariibacter sp. P117]